MNFKLIIFILIFSYLSCATFIEEKEKNFLKLYEKKFYRVNQDVKVGNFSLKKGQKINIIINTTDTFIKVYGYSSDTNRLKADMVLLLYLFEDDFANSRFDRVEFEKKIYSIIEEIK